MRFFFLAIYFRRNTLICVSIYKALYHRCICDVQEKSIVNRAPKAMYWWCVVVVVVFFFEEINMLSARPVMGRFLLVVSLRLTALPVDWLILWSQQLINVPRKYETLLLFIANTIKSLAWFIDFNIKFCPILETEVKGVLKLLGAFRAFGIKKYLYQQFLSGTATMEYRFEANLRV